MTTLIRCPFCDEDGFDKVGLRMHIERGHCDGWDKAVETPEPQLTIECGLYIPCDICGKQPTSWVGNTSATVCADPKCRAEMALRYDDHAAAVEAEYAQPRNH